MPKISPDENLLMNVRALVASNACCSAAAKVIGINKATLWRFLKTGSAIERNKAILRSAVDAVESEPRDRDSETNEASTGPATGLSLDDLERMKSMCQTMILMIESFTDSSLKGRGSSSAPDPARCALHDEQMSQRRK